MKDKDLHAHHISQQFNTELDDIKTRMLEMGGVVEKQVADAINAFMSQDSGLAEDVDRGDRIVNALELSIDEDCTIDFDHDLKFTIFSPIKRRWSC